MSATNTAESEPLWDARDVAGYLKVSRSWVYRQSESGTLPHLKVGGLVRFVPEEVMAFAQSGRAARGEVLNFTKVKKPMNIGEAGTSNANTRKIPKAE